MREFAGNKITISNQLSNFFGENVKYLLSEFFWKSI